jgi:CSLREA domain-containing protein
VLCCVALASLSLLSVASVSAQPANDAYADREVIASLPFTDTEALIGAATVEVGDPIVFCRAGTASQGGNTVWYSYTTGASDEYLNLITTGSTYDTMVAVYTGAPGAFTLVSGGCNDDGIPAVLQSRIAGLRLRASTTYSILVARFTANVATVTLNFAVSAAPLYNVSKTTDTADGVCDADCSLREAIGASNVTPGAVLVPAGNYALTLAGAGEDNNATGDLDVKAALGLYGAGATATVIDAGDLDRPLHVDAGTATNRISAHLNGLTLTNGTVTNDGGGVLLAAASDFLTLDDVAITNNVATLNGGGLRSASRALLRRVTLRGNQAGSNGGGASFSGGLDTTVEVRDSTIDGNLSQSAVSGGGGGIHATARLRLDQVTVSGNSANFAGGGVYVTAAGTLVMRNATIVGNIADANNNDASSGGGLRLESSATYNIANSVVANNYTDGLPANANDCSRSTGALTSAYNHVRTPDTCTFAGTGDVTGSDPLVAPALAANGGPTTTHAVLDGSPLIDTGDPAGCLDDGNLALLNDQRGSGFARTVDGNSDTSAVCDKGAFEYVPAVPSAPSNLIATAVGDTSASLQWDDNSSNEVSFQIERALSAGGPWTNVGAVSANTTTFVDSSLSPLTDYYFRVFARNAGGDSAATTALMVHTTPVELLGFAID